MEDQSTYSEIRDRWDKEDTLLLTRTGIFLTANSIFLAGSQLQKDSNFQLSIAILSLIISILWLTTTYHSYKIIGNLYNNCIDIMPEKIKSIYEVKPSLFRPNTTLGIVVPSVMIIGWIVYIWYLTSCYKP